MVYLSQIIRN